MICDDETARGEALAEAPKGSLQLHDLPEDILYVILSFCDIQSLGRVARSCRLLRRLANAECIWTRRTYGLFVVGDSCQHGSCCKNTRLPAKEKYRIAPLWQKGCAAKSWVIKHRHKQMPWMQKTDSDLWISNLNTVQCYHVRRGGELVADQDRILRKQSADVTRFVCKQGKVLVGSSDGTVAGYCHQTGQLLWRGQHCSYGEGDVQAVDCHDNLAVTGSKDATVKIFPIPTDESDEDRVVSAHTIHTEDRVWSLALAPTGGVLVTGTAGRHGITPLKLWDTESGTHLSDLGSNYRNGAGMLDIQFESMNVLFTCGHDTVIRMWDLRMRLEQCICSWMEPFDYTIYCVCSDGNNALVAGTSHHGMVRLWDKRSSKPVQVMYAHQVRSPVYSLSFDPRRLYLGLDRGIHMLDFSSC